MASRALLRSLVCILLLGVVVDRAQAQNVAAKPATVTREQFQALRFLEGDWKGTGYAPGPFYESYRFVGDSTIEMTGWSDAALTRPNGQRSTYVFRDGQIRKADGSAAVTRIDSMGYHFETLRGPSRGWVFRRISADRWTATLGSATTYTMDRLNR